MLMLRGRAGSSFDAEPRRCFMGGVAILEDEAADEDDDDRLSERGDGGGSESSDAIAGEGGKGGARDGRL